MKIGFFDSGLGGLTILKAVREHMPQYDYVYFGDTQNLPYGSKTEEEIYKLAHEGIEKLFLLNAQIVIVACNTISAQSLRKLQDTVFNKNYPDRRVLGVIIPTIETLTESNSKNVLLIGTERTIMSQKYPNELAKAHSDILIQSIATPDLVPKIEAHQFDDAFISAKKYIGETMPHIDTVILGCTHYTIIKDALRKEYPNHTIISQDEIIPSKLKSYVERHPEIEKKLSKERSLEIVLSKHTEQYERIQHLFFGDTLTQE